MGTQSAEALQWQKAGRRRPHQGRQQRTARLADRDGPSADPPRRTVDGFGGQAQRSWEGDRRGGGCGGQSLGAVVVPSSTAFLPGSLKTRNTSTQNPWKGRNDFRTKLRSAMVQARSRKRLGIKLVFRWGNLTRSKPTHLGYGQHRMLG